MEQREKTVMGGRPALFRVGPLGAVLFCLVLFSGLAAAHGGDETSDSDPDRLTAAPHGHYNQPFLRYFPTAGRNRVIYGRDRRDLVASIRGIPIVGGLWLIGGSKGGEGEGQGDVSGGGGGEVTPADGRRSKVVGEARRLLEESEGQDGGDSGGKGRSGRLPADSVELVRMAYGAANVKVRAGQVKGADPVASLQQYTLGKGYIYHETGPAPGDLVFFRQVLEKGSDGRTTVVYPGDVAIVEKVLKGGTVVAIHVRNGKVGRINLHPERRRERRDEKSGRILNTYLREKRKSDSKHAEYLAGELWDGFGNLLVR